MSSTPPVSDRPGAAAGRSRRLTSIVPAVVIAAVVMLRVALPLAIPPLAAWLAKRDAGLDLRIADVDLSLLRGVVAIEGLWVGRPGRAPTDGSPPHPTTGLLAWDRLEANLAWTDLLQRRIHLTDVSIDAPDVRVVRREDGSFESLLGARAAEAREAEPADEVADEPTPAAEPGETWTASVDGLGLRGGQLRVVDAATGEEFLSFALDELDLERFSLDADSVGLGRFSLHRPHLRVHDEFLREPAGAPEPASAPEAVDDAAPEAATAPSRGYRIDDVVVDAAEFELLYGERALAVVLSLETRDIAFERGHTFPLQAHLEIGDTGRLDFSGQAGAVPPVLTGRVRANGVPLQPLSLPLREDLHGWLRGARADADLTLDLRDAASDASGARLRVGGRVTVADLDLEDPRSDDLAVGVQKMDVQLRELVVPLGEAAAERAVRVAVERVGLVSPSARYRRPTDALDRLLHGPPSAAADERKAGPPARIRVDRVEISSGALELHDGGVEPAFDARVSKLAGAIAGVDPTAPSAERVNLDFTLNARASVDVDGRLGADGAELAVKASRLDLPSLNPYARAAGVQVKQGSLTLDSDVTAEGAHWTLDNDVVLHRLKLDHAASQEFISSLGMPIDLVLAVLRDTQGNIRLDVPVEFDRGESETDLPVVLAGALRQALVGAASIPLKSLASLLGVRGARIDPVPFAPGVSAHSEDSDERGFALVELLNEQPNLVVVLTGRAGKADRALLPEAAAPPPVASGPEGEATEGEAVDARYDALARARAATVRDWLVKEQGVDAARVVVAEDTERGAPAVLLGFDTFPAPSEEPAAGSAGG